MSTLLRPSPIRIILALVLFALSTYLWHLYVISTISDTFPWGFPLEFYTAWGPCPPGEICSESNGLFLILDVVFWYLLSGLLVPKPGMKEMKREEV